MSYISDDEKIRVIRISMSDYTTKEDCDYLITTLVDIVPKIK